MFNNRLALLTSIPVAFSWVFIFFTGRPLTNLPATFFFIFALLFFWKSYVKNQGHIYSILFGIFFALSALIRMQYLMFSLAFLAFAIVKEKWKFVINKKLWISIIAFFIILIPQFYWQSTKFGNPILDLATYYLGVGGSQSGEVGVQLAKFSDLFVYFNNIPYVLDANQLGYSTLLVFSPLYALFLIGFVLFFSDLFLNPSKLFKSEKLQKKFFILFWTLSAFLFLGYIAPHLEQRYIMPIIPFLFLITVYPLYLSAIYIKDKYKNKFNDKYNPIIIFIILSAILIILMIPNYNFGNSLVDSKKAGYIEIRQAGEWIKANSNPEDIILGGSLPQLTYYSERTVYPFHLAYRRDIEKKEEADLDKFILENRPKYFSISGYEAEKDWAFAYPQKHSDLLTPVQAFPPTEQPILIIYRFDYSNIEAVARLADLGGVGIDN
jgi:4-amino-4-deoxy-L-arabinose transferase-like glycosyltransferase